MCACECVEGKCVSSSEIGEMELEKGLENGGVVLLLEKPLAEEADDWRRDDDSGELEMEDLREEEMLLSRASCWEWRRRYFCRAKARSGDFWQMVGLVVMAIVGMLLVSWLFL